MTLIEGFLTDTWYTPVHLFDSVHSYECDQVHLSLPKVILNVKSAICPDCIELDADFLHIARLQQKQQIDTAIWSGLQ